MVYMATMYPMDICSVYWKRTYINGSFTGEFTQKSTTSALTITDVSTNDDAKIL